MNSYTTGGVIQVDGTDNAQEQPLTIDDGDNGSMNSAPMIFNRPSLRIDEHQGIQLED